MVEQLIGAFNILIIFISNVQGNNNTTTASYISQVVLSTINITSNEVNNIKFDVSKNQTDHIANHVSIHLNNTNEADNNTRDVCRSFNIQDRMSGLLTSPNFPNHYQNNVTCLWSIQPPQNAIVVISFEKFNLEPGIDNATTCPFDFLCIFEEFKVKRKIPHINGIQNVRYRRTIGTYCGDRLPGQLRTNRIGSTVYVYFHTDETNTAEGFSFKYEFLEITDSVSTNTWQHKEKRSPSAEEEFIKVFSCIIFIIVFLIVFTGSFYKCWKSTSEQLEAEGRIHHTCCCGTIRFDIVARNRPHGGVRSERLSSPRLPTPPPQYGDVVKTEEDWNRVVQQLGEASALALRQRIATEEVQVTYDLGVTERSPQSSLASISVTDVSSTSTMLERRHTHTLPIRLEISTTRSASTEADFADESDTNSESVSERAL